MSAAHAFLRTNLVLSCAFMIVFPIAYLLSEAEKDSAQAKAKVPAPPVETKVETKAQPEKGYTRPEWDRRPEETKAQATATSSITPEDGYATQLFNWLKSPHSLYGWLRTLEIMLVPGMLYAFCMGIDQVRGVRAGGGH